MTTGSWSPAANNFRYQWLRQGAPISGATGSSYKVSADDAGRDVSVIVFASSSLFQLAIMLRESNFLLLIASLHPILKCTDLGLQRLDLPPVLLVLVRVGRRHVLLMTFARTRADRFSG